MIASDLHDITDFLNGSNTLNRKSKIACEKAVYVSLKRIASNKITAELSKNTLTVPALVHETFLRLHRARGTNWRSRQHFFGAAAQTMKRVLIDHARYQLRQCREGESAAVSLDERYMNADLKPCYLVELDDALIDLESQSEELARIVKLKYYAGLTTDEIAGLLHTSPRTVVRKLKTGRCWLQAQMELH